MFIGEKFQGVSIMVQFLGLNYRIGESGEVSAIGSLSNRAPILRNYLQTDCTMVLLGMKLEMQILLQKLL